MKHYFIYFRDNTIILVVAIFFLNNRAIAAPHILDKIVAIVENSIVLDSDINNIINSIKRTNKTISEDHICREHILQKLIINNILLQLVQRTDITISDDTIDKFIKLIADQNNMTIDQLQCNFTYKGMDYNTYRMQIRKDMLITKMRNKEVLQRMNICPEEVDTLAKQIVNSNSMEFHISHLFISFPNNVSHKQIEQISLLAKLLVKLCRNGVDIHTLAKIYSTNTQIVTITNLGWGKYSEFPILFSERLYDAKKGNIIGPIRSDMGLHILKVNDRRNVSKNIEVHIRHILLLNSENRTDQQARTKLMEISKNIKDGKISFSTAATKLSEDKISANGGGNLPWKPIEYFDYSIRNVLINLQNGEISMPVQSLYGWHLIQLINTRQRLEDLVQNQEIAYRLLFKRKFSDEAKIWLQEKLSSVYIKILDG